MNKRTLKALIAHVFIFGCSTVSLVWTGFDVALNEAAMWKPAINAIAWGLSLGGAVLCYRDLRGKTNLATTVTE